MTFDLAQCQFKCDFRIQKSENEKGKLKMKKLICAAVVASSMFVMGEEFAAPVAESAAPVAETAAPVAESAAPTAVSEAAKAVPRRPQVTPEERAKRLAQREKFVAERKAKMEAQMLEVVKKYVPEDEKAKALVKELQDAMMDGRRNMMRRPPKRDAAKPAEAK